MKRWEFVEETKLVKPSYLRIDQNKISGFIDFGSVAIVKIFEIPDEIWNRGGINEAVCS